MTKKNGFTLIEMLTAMSVFVLVAGLLSGLFFSSLNLQRRAFASRDLQDNARYILDLMSKEIRTANPITFSQPGGATALSFTNDSGVLVNYSWGGSSILRNSPLQLTSTTINVQLLNFVLSGAGTNDNQPRVTIILKMSSTTNPQAPSLEAQTTISTRQLDPNH